MTGADGDEGLRGHKKRQVRQAIAAAAMHLFERDGFEAVTISQIARAAQVADKTVYNYFPRKTDLFFDEADDILAELLHAVTNRRRGQSALDAVQVFVAGRAEWAAARRPARPSRRYRQLIADSPVLRAALRDMFGRYESALADVLAEETYAAHGAAEPFAAAVALIGIVRVAVEARGAGQSASSATASAVRLLRDGIGGYAIAGER